MTYTHRIDVTVNQGRMEGFGWKAKLYGKANAENLCKWVDRMNLSFSEGGTNAHLAGHLILTARLIHQKSGRVVAEAQTQLNVAQALGVAQ